MAGLILNLKAGEKFLVNGVVMQNGSKRAQIRVETENANILRLSDALHPDDVNTPVKRVYFQNQLILSGDVSAEEAVDDLLRSLKELQAAFGEVGEPHMEKAISATEKGRFYSTLCSLKSLLPIEAQLLNHTSVTPHEELPDQRQEARRVA